MSDMPLRFLQEPPKGLKREYDALPEMQWLSQQPGMVALRMETTAL